MRAFRWRPAIWSSTAATIASLLPVPGSPCKAAFPEVKTAPAISIQGPDLAAFGQGPLVAWVENASALDAYQWELEGAEPLGPLDQPHVVFRTGSGRRVILRCRGERSGIVLGLGTWNVPLLADLPHQAPAFLIEHPTAAPKGLEMAGVAVQEPDEARYAYTWSAEGASLLETAGPRVRMKAGSGDRAVVRCLRIRRDNGVRDVVEGVISLVPPLAVPEVTLPALVFENQSRLARPAGAPAEAWVERQWTHEGLEVEPLRQDDPDGSFRFRARQSGRATLTCTIQDIRTGQSEVWTRTFDVRPDRASIPPARILEFRCDPESPLPVDTVSARLRWTLDRDPEGLLLEELLTGQRWALAASDRSFTLPLPLVGRQKFRLTTSLLDAGRDEVVTDVRLHDVVVPGVSVVAGNARDVGSAYMRSSLPGVTPWSGVTGLAWKDGWLYFAQGGQHTIRRARITAGEVEEVAGMRGLPRNDAAPGDLLLEPGPIVPRSYPGPGGLVVQDWLVLQTRANCVMAFREGLVAGSMRVIAGEFRLVAPASTDPGALRDPIAIAVHAPTGHFIVADRGNRAIKLFAPDGSSARVLVSGLEAGGVAVSEEGHVFYTDPAQHVVMMLRCLGGPFGMAAAFAVPAAFAGAPGEAGSVDGGRIGTARLRLPMGLALDVVDRPWLLIADAGNHLVRKVPADPTTQEDVETIGGNPALNPGEVHPVAVHASGIVARADLAAREVRIFSADGLHAHAVPNSRGLDVRGIALDRIGNLFLADPSRHVVRVMRLLNPPLSPEPIYGDPEVFAGVQDIPGKAGGERTTAARMRSPEGLALDPRDPSMLLVTDTANQTLWRVSLDLERPATMKDGGRPSPPAHPVPEGGWVDGRQAEARFACPRQVCGDGLGRVFVQDQAADGRAPVIRVLDPFGEVATLGGITIDRSRRGREDGPGLAVGFDGPTGLVVAPSGVIHVADAGNRCIRRIDPRGNVTVAAGGRSDPDGTDGDDGRSDAARFGSLGCLTMDGKGRILVLEPGFQRIRMIDLQAGRDSGGPSPVTSPATNLPPGLMAFFPASEGTANLVFAFAEPLADPGLSALKVRRMPSHVETVHPRLEVQALCVDRRNRIVVAMPPDPARRGVLRIRRFSHTDTAGPQPDVSWYQDAPADLPLGADGGPRIVDGRPYAACGETRIAAMAADSRGNIFLADAANGMVWMVDEEISRASRVAGAYPYLGPVGPGLDAPLPPMQGIALTPDDDLLVSCGNAVLRIVRHKAVPALPWAWKNAPFGPRPVLGRSSRVAADEGQAKRSLKDPRRDQRWRMELNRCRRTREAAYAALQSRRSEKRNAEWAAAEDVSSRAARALVENLALALARDEHAHALAVAEDEARNASFAYLLLKDHGTGTDLQVDCAMARAECEILQARFEELQIRARMEALHPEDPLRGLLRARLDFLGALIEGKLASAIVARHEKAARSYPLRSAAREAEKERKAKALAALAARLPRLDEADRVLRSLLDAHPAADIGRFASWVEPGLSLFPERP